MFNMSSLMSMWGYVKNMFGKKDEIGALLPGITDNLMKGNPELAALLQIILSKGQDANPNIIDLDNPQKLHDDVMTLQKQINVLAERRDKLGKILEALKSTESKPS